jgi:hypothetical protein
MANRLSFRTASALAALLAAASISACVAKEEEPPPPPPTPNVVTVRASDFSYILPAEIPSGFTTFRLVNDGPNLHHMVIARLDSGKTIDDARAALGKHGPPPGWFVPVGGPNAPEAQAQSNATLDMKPGNYVVFCMVDIPGGVPHAAKGMINALTVVPATGPTAGAPTPDITITLSDFVFGLSPQISKGSHTIAVVTAPGQPHELELIKFAPGKTMDDFMKDVQTLMSGKPIAGPMSAVEIGGVAPAVARYPRRQDASRTRHGAAVLDPVVVAR